jgi:hypothetical protein
MFHPLRHKNPAIVVLSVSGMPDEDHFNSLSNHVNYLLASPDRKLLAEIYRPAAEIMMSPFFKEKYDDILNATKQAGKELIKSMKISSKTKDRITQPLVEAKSFADLANLYWKTCIAEGVTPKEFTKNNMVPRPDSLKSFMFLFPFGINSKAVCDTKVTLQFKFSGAVEDSCYFNIQKANIEAQTGISENPAITIETPFDIWIDIMTGKADGQQMFMEQKYTATGDIPLMIQLFQKE